MFPPSNALEYREFFRLLIEVSLFVKAVDPGLTLEQVLEVAARLNVSPGPLRDAFRDARANRLGDRYEYVAKRALIKALPPLTQVHPFQPIPGIDRHAALSVLRDYIAGEVNSRGVYESRLSVDALIRAAETAGVPENDIRRELEICRFQGIYKVKDGWIQGSDIYLFSPPQIDPEAASERQEEALERAFPLISSLLSSPQGDQETPPQMTHPSANHLAKAPMQAVRRVFVSHSTEIPDQGVAKDFIKRVLVSGIGISKEQIFFSSEKGSIPPGKYYIPYIREQLQSAEVVIALITPKFYGSAFCMCELGAAWSSVPDGLVPILNGIGYDQMKGVLGGMQALLATKREDLNELRDHLTRVLALTPTRHNHWEEERDEFMRVHI